MNELFNVTTNGDKLTLSARELHKELNVTDRFTRWFERMGEYGFEENIDFTSVKSSTLVNNGATSDTSILIGDLAKLIKQNGTDIGQKRLFERMRNDGYLIKKGTSKNMPTQMAMEKGLFEVKERTISNPDGSTRITRTTKVTGKGQIYFINKFKNA